MLSSDHEKEKLDAGHLRIRGLSFISGSGLALDCVCVWGGLMQLNEGIAVNYGQK